METGYQGPIENYPFGPKGSGKTVLEMKDGLNDVSLRMECLKLAYKTLSRRMVSSKIEDLIVLSEDYFRYVKTGGL